jgi:imidazolonepropionase-like amidohydrolase
MSIKVAALKWAHPENIGTFGRASQESASEPRAARIPRSSALTRGTNMRFRNIVRTAAAAIVTLLAASCASTQPPDDRPVIAIEDVTVLSMRPGEEPYTATVLIVNDRIAAIGPSGAVAVPRHARRVDGAGRWLMPGLTDMHVHVDNARLMRMLSGDDTIPDGGLETADIYLPYIANGVTQIVNMAGTAENLAQRDEIAAGGVLGPHIFVGAMVDGDPPLWPPGFANSVATPEQARTRVRALQAEGYDFIKTYNQLGQDSFSAIIDEARSTQGRVVGHLPGRGQGRIEDYLVPGFELVTHAEEFAYQTRSFAESEQAIPRYAELARRNGVAIVATLTTDERILEQMQSPETLRSRDEVRFVHPYTRRWWYNNSPYADAPAQRIEFVAQVVQFNRLLVKAFADAGVPVFTGTDALIPGIVPGFSLHDEFESLAAAGLSNEHILMAATRGASEWLGVGADRGSIAVGMRADLVLLGADPLADIGNTREIAAVFVNGRMLERSELDAMMADLDRRYAAMQ